MKKSLFFLLLMIWNHKERNWKTKKRRLKQSWKTQKRKFKTFKKKKWLS